MAHNREKNRPQVFADPTRSSPIPYGAAYEVRLAAKNVRLFKGIAFARTVLCQENRDPCDVPIASKDIFGAFFLYAS